jgi:hypothetical protein
MSMTTNTNAINGLHGAKMQHAGRVERADTPKMLKTKV